MNKHITQAQNKYQNICVTHTILGGDPHAYQSTHTYAHSSSTMGGYQKGIMVTIDQKAFRSRKDVLTDLFGVPLFRTEHQSTVET